MVSKPWSVPAAVNSDVSVVRTMAGRGWPASGAPYMPWLRGFLPHGPHGHTVTVFALLPALPDACKYRPYDRPRSQPASMRAASGSHAWAMASIVVSIPVPAMRAPIAPVPQGQLACPPSASNCSMMALVLREAPGHPAQQKRVTDCRTRRIVGDRLAMPQPQGESHQGAQYAKCPRESAVAPGAEARCHRGAARGHATRQNDPDFIERDKSNSVLDAH
jgi:hypothetical protein